ncbi:MAG: bifunctional diguanylate cyclase/phosphodiesterase [Egibacteraceae bacterium]
MVALAGSVGAGYFVIALVVAPRIRMPSAPPAVVLIVRGAAIMFFLACGLTHLHIVAHTLGIGGRVYPVEGHDLIVHVAQAVGAWLFIVGAALKLELHVVPSERSAKQRDIARAQLADEQVITAALKRRTARASALASISERALAERDLTAFAHDTAEVVRGTLPERCTVTLAGEAAVGEASGSDRHPLVLRSAGDPDDADREFVSSVNNVLANVGRRLHLEEQLRHRSLHDPLTGLPNRVLLLDRLGVALARQRRGDGPFAVLFVDLDGFKQINDTLGHDAGDRLLVEVAARLSAICRPQDTLARQSGDEFVMVCEATTTEAAVGIAQRAVDSLSKPFSQREGAARVTASVGVAISDGACDAEELVRRADAAMYRAKQRGPGEIETYTSALRSQAVRSDQFDQDLRHAITRGELSLVYQPIVALAAPGEGDRVIGAEGLLRWHHPVDGLVSPALFIPIAEARGLIGPIGDWVMTRVCAQAARWRAQMPDDHDLLVAMNLSVCQLAEPDFAAKVTAAVRAAGARPEDLVLELTETAVIEGDQALVATLCELRSLGLRIALDDFGTGYSSLTHLRTLPLDILKVDRSFVAGLGQRGTEQAIVTALAALTQGLGMQVVAEGVETVEQLQAIRHLGLEMAQGYLLGRPMRSAEVADLLPAAGRPAAGFIHGRHT